MIEIKKINQAVKYSVFKSKLAKNDEYFLAVNPASQDFKEALKETGRLYSNFLKKTKLSPDSQIFCRFFLSDMANQKEILLASKIMSAVKGSFSIIEETPLNGSKVSMLSYHIDNKKIKKEILSIKEDGGWRNGLKLKGENYDLIYMGNMADSKIFNPEVQTKSIFDFYTAKLKELGCSLFHNCVRTWIFVRDIDNNYSGMVKARREHFAQNGLNKNTKFIASTGIEAKLKESRSLVSVDALAISNLKPEQMVRMEALSHLNPTHEYGVTFERGSKIVFGDRAHLYLSGTASINNKGEVLHPYDVRKQTARVLENISALLRPHQASLKDMGYLIVYMRNITDVSLVKEILDKNKLNKLPIFFVEGAVCRPEWLVEIEGVAVTDQKTNWPDFL
jgi:enamine deaminase RidA (YjgF/YER057c/UK114 family)